MRKLVLVVHTSLDGFVADKEGSLEGFEVNEENLEFVCSLTKKADTALFGRVSFQLLHRYWPNRKDNADATWNEMVYSCWYNAAEKIVVSQTLEEKDYPGVTILRTNAAEQIAKLKKKPGRQVLIFGSPSLVQSLLPHDLIDEYRVFVHPVVLGEGIPLFGSDTKQTKLRLLRSKQLAGGEMALHYTVQKNAWKSVRHGELDLAEN